MKSGKIKKVIFNSQTRTAAWLRKIRKGFEELELINPRTKVELENNEDPLTF